MKRLLLSSIAAFLLSLQALQAASPLSIRLYPNGFMFAEGTNIMVTAVVEPDPTNRQLEISVEGDQSHYSTIDLTTEQNRKSFTKIYRIGTGRYVAEAILSRLDGDKWTRFTAKSATLTVCGAGQECLPSQP